MEPTTESLLKFPVAFPLKVMGRNVPEFLPAVSGIIAQHLRTEEPIEYTSRESANGKYLSITATFMAQSKEQLDAIYSQLKACNLVLMSL